MRVMMGSIPIVGTSVRDSDTYLRKVIMYIEITDTIAIIIALTLSTTLVITTAIKNAKLARALRELSVK